MRYRLIAAISVLFVTSFSQAADEQTKPTFEQYIHSIKQEAMNKGFDSALLETAFAKVKYYKRAVKADRSQPETVETLDTYLPKRVPEWKVKKAREMYTKHYDMLQEIGKKYQVQPRFIVALWGLETNFGKIMGNFNVVSALSTLAYDGRREVFFKKQLWSALSILEQGHIDIDNMKGSWAGAMGQSQFMPSSFMAYAVDGDGDGKKDIWGNLADVFSSMANYLSKEGWSDELTWGRQVKLPEGFDHTLSLPRNTGSRKNWLAAWDKTEKSLKQWQALGLRRMDGRDLPQVNINAALLYPDDGTGRVYLGYNNYKTLMHWNLSYYFVTSVGYLSDRIQYPAIEPKA